MCVGLQAARREERYEEGVEQLRRQGLHEKAVLLERTRTRLEGILARTPREDEIAHALHIDLDALRTMARQTEFGTISFEDLSPTTRIGVHANAMAFQQCAVGQFFKH